ncbi:MAG TPA: hypothetical protein VF062_08720 [Candidatus Limnocylindrales bacterium]
MSVSIASDQTVVPSRTTAPTIDSVRPWTWACLSLTFNARSVDPNNIA